MRQLKIHMTITVFFVLTNIYMMITAGSLDWLQCLLIVLLIALEFMPLLLKKKARGVFQEVARDGKLRYAASFTESNIHVENYTNGASADVPLASFKKVISVNGVWVLMSKAGFLYMVFADQLSEADRVSVLNLLKQHNPKLKIAKDMNKSVCTPN